MISSTCEEPDVRDTLRHESSQTELEMGMLASLSDGVVPVPSKPANVEVLAESHHDKRMPINVRNSLQSLRYKQECRRHNLLAN